MSDRDRLLGNPEGQDVRNLVLGLCGIRDDQLEPGGCCFLLAQGLAVTAKHVIADIDERFAIREPKAGRNDRDYAVHASASAHLGPVTFEVSGVYYCDWSDMALLQLVALNAVSYAFPVVTPSLDFAPPGVGTEVFTFGYPNQQAQIEDGLVIWNSEVRASVGIVQGYWPERRDTRVLTFPSFQTNAAIHGHMSGGPIISANGVIVGIAVASLDDGEGGEPISYGASLWPLLGTAIFDPLTGEHEDGHYFFDLFANNFLPGENWNHPEFDRRNSRFGKAVPRPRA